MKDSEAHRRVFLTFDLYERGQGAADGLFLPPERWETKLALFFNSVFLKSGDHFNLQASVYKQ